MTSRRKLIKTSAGIAVGGSSLFGLTVEARTRLDALGYEDTLAALSGGDIKSAGDAVQLDVPSVVSNGAFVTVTLRSNVPDIEIMHLLIDNHPVSHVASMQPLSRAYLSLSIRIAIACRVTALVKTANGWLRQDATIETVQTGCEV